MPSKPFYRTVIILENMRVRDFAIVVGFGFAVLNLLSYTLSYAMLSVNVWFINGFVSWFITILFAIGGIMACFGGMFGTFLGRVMYYTPFGHVKSRNTSGEDENDNKLTDTGLPFVLIGVIAIAESVIVGYLLISKP